MMPFHYRQSLHLEKKRFLLLLMLHHLHRLNWGRLQPYHPRRYFLVTEKLMEYFPPRLFEQAHY